MAINVQLPMEREEYDTYVGLLRMHGIRFVGPMLANCLKEKAEALKALSDLNSVRPSVQTQKNSQGNKS